MKLRILFAALISLYSASALAKTAYKGDEIWIVQADGTLSKKFDVSTTEQFIVYHDGKPVRYYTPPRHDLFGCPPREPQPQPDPPDFDFPGDTPEQEVPDEPVVEAPGLFDSLAGQNQVIPLSIIAAIAGGVSAFFAARASEAEDAAEGVDHETDELLIDDPSDDEE